MLTLITKITQGAPVLSTCGCEHEYARGEDDAAVMDTEDHPGATITVSLKKESSTLSLTQPGGGGARVAGAISCLFTWCHIIIGTCCINILFDHKKYFCYVFASMKTFMVCKIYQ